MTQTEQYITINFNYKEVNTLTCLLLQYSEYLFKFKICIIY